MRLSPCITYVQHLHAAISLHYLRSTHPTSVPSKVRNCADILRSDISFLRTSNILNLRYIYIWRSPFKDANASLFVCSWASEVGGRVGLSPWILKWLAKKVVFSISRTENQISPLLAQPWKKFWENPLLPPPLEKILPKPMCVFAWLRSCMPLVRNKTYICSVYNFLRGNTAPYYRNLKWTREDSLSCFCRAIKPNSRTKCTQVSQLASTDRQSNRHEWTANAYLRNTRTLNLVLVHCGCHTGK